MQTTRFRCRSPLADAGRTIDLLPIEIGRLANPSLPADVGDGNPVSALSEYERLLRVRKLRGFHRLPLLPARENTAENSNSERTNFSGSRSTGGTLQDQASALKNLSLLPIDAQLSDRWLGGREKSGIAKILKDTSVFLKDQKKISEILPSYAAFVTTDAIAGPKKPGT